MTPREVAQVQAELVQTKARLANARLRVHTYQRRVEQLQQILDEHDKAMTGCHRFASSDGWRRTAPTPGTDQPHATRFGYGV